MRPTNYRVRADATAFVHRGESFLIQQLVVFGADATPAERDAARDWLARWWALVHPWGSGCVRELSGPGPPGLGARLLRDELQPPPARQGGVDPRDFFRFHQSLT